jgi:hypothetical protein
MSFYEQAYHALVTIWHWSVRETIVLASLDQTSSCCSLFHFLLRGAASLELFAEGAPEDHEKDDDVDVLAIVLRLSF